MYIVRMRTLCFEYQTHLKLGFIHYEGNKIQENENQLMYKALEFRYKKLYSRMFRIWHQKSQLQWKLRRIDQKLNKVILGFPFYILKSHFDNADSFSTSKISIQDQNLYYEYQAELVRNRLLKIMKQKHVFNTWKRISFKNRVDFPYNYYNKKI